MNREIEFRGKHIHILKENEKLDGTWVYGYLCSENYIFSEEFLGEMLVDKNTVGQYTGLKDKNGKKIFEGDIIRLDDDYRKSISSCDAKTEEELVRKDCLVGFKDGSFMFCRNRYVIDDFDSYLWLSNKYCEVIGNIYDNNLESRGDK